MSTLWMDVRDLPTRSTQPPDSYANVIAVQLDYHRFIPSGKAFLRLQDPSQAKSTLQKLQGLILDGTPIAAAPCPDPGISRRLRGKEGRVQASNRGVITGDGPEGGIRVSGREVVLWGLPGGVSQQQVKRYLVKQGLVPEGLDGNGECEVLKVDQYVTFAPHIFLFHALICHCKVLSWGIPQYRNFSFA